MTRLLITSGLSGAGKTTVLRVLEDMGFSCIDNLPFALLPSLVEHIKHVPEGKHFAISIDARNTSTDLQQFPTIFRSSIMEGVDCQVLFVDSSDTVLLQRFSETRRRHPLSNHDVDLREALNLERELLAPINKLADLVIDTSKLSIYDLRNLIKQRVMDGHVPGVAILFQSFGFKYGISQDADLVFDVRCLPNPYWVLELRALNGTDEPVIEFLDKKEAAEQMFDDISQFLTTWLPRYEASNRSYITIGIGCTGGKHRSVYIAEKLYQHFKSSFDNIQIRHRELARAAAPNDKS